MNLLRLLPHRFFSQVLFFVGLTVMLASLLVGGVFTYESVARTRIQHNKEIVFLAQNIAAMAGMPIITNDTEFLDDILKLNAQFSFVDSILIVDAENNALSEVVKVNGAITKVSLVKHSTPQHEDEAIDLKPPRNIIFTILGNMIPPDTNMELWHPIRAGKLLGSIRIHYSQKEFRQQIITQWIHTFLYACLTVVVMFWLLRWVLRRPMRTLRETALFANNLSTNIGSHIDIYSGTKELFDLTGSLNALSFKLQTQQQDLLKSAAHNQSILDNVADGIISLNANGNIHLFNVAASKIFGYSYAEIENQNIRVLLPRPEENNDEFPANENSIEVGVQELNAVRKNGSQFPAEITITRTNEQNENIYICIVRDITERQRLDRMKSEFVSTVSHELRTPLTSINGALKIIDSGSVGAVPEMVNSLIGVAIKNSQRLIILINDLLDMEKLAAGKMQLSIAPVNLIECIEQSIESNVSYAANHNVSYVFGEHPEQIMVLADVHRLAQVITNILSNAAKFSAGYPRVDVRVIIFSNMARVEIEDHGKGIPIDFQSEIFGAFAQANNGNTRVQGGSGLGLKISKALINDMRGEIGFTTEIGKGSVFWFTLPLVGAESVERL